MDAQLNQQLQTLGGIVEGLGQTLKCDVNYTYETLTYLRDTFNQCAVTIQEVRDVSRMQKEI